MKALKVDRGELVVEDHTGDSTTWEIETKR